MGIIEDNKLREYLSRVNSKNEKELETIISSKGELNDVDYYIEIMKEKTPNKMLKVILKH